MRERRRWLIGFFAVLISVIYGMITPVRADLSNFAHPGALLNLSDVSFLGENNGDEAGIWVAGGGDVDGDGLDDILVGASSNSDGGWMAGKTYLFLGSTIVNLSGSVSAGDADYTFVGESNGKYSGKACAIDGDVDNDGLGDILIGATYNDDGGDAAGKTYLFFGKNLPAKPATLYLGSDEDRSFIGEAAYDYSGQAVAFAGDVDGDGLDDILIGAVKNNSGGNDSGKSYLIISSTLPARPAIIRLANADFGFIGEEAGDYSGESVSSAGDIDGDGLDDILIGAPFSDPDPGSAAGKSYLIFGKSLRKRPRLVDLYFADHIFVGENRGDMSGTSVASAGDVDGDGYSDILIGATGNSDVASSAGKSYLYLGSSITAARRYIRLGYADYIFFGEYWQDESGACVSRAGDVNGDGLSDILIGVPWNDDSGSDSGKACLIMAAP